MNVSNNCYYALVPQDAAKVDASGHVKGSDLRGTPGYEHFVESLSRHINPSVQASAEIREQAQAAVDGMYIKSGITLVVPCPAGHSDADRFVPQSAVQSDRPSTPQALARQPRGLWPHVIDLTAQFFAGLTGHATASTVTSRVASPAPNAPEPVDAASQPNPDNADQLKEMAKELRDYDRILNAMAHNSGL